jgi:hypothetical protein
MQDAMGIGLVFVVRTRYNIHKLSWRRVQEKVGGDLDKLLLCDITHVVAGKKNNK